MSVFGSPCLEVSLKLVNESSHLAHLPGFGYQQLQPLPDTVQLYNCAFYALILFQT